MPYLRQGGPPDLVGSSRQGDRVGGALVEGVHVALVNEPALGRAHETVGADDPLEVREEGAAQGHDAEAPGGTTRSSRCLPKSGAWRCRRGRALRRPSAPARG